MKLIKAYETGISTFISCCKGLPVQHKFESVEGVLGVGTTHAINRIKGVACFTRLQY